MSFFQRSSFFVIPLLGGVLSATLVACGGGGGGSGGGGGGSQVLNGLTIDGYIKDAKVCLDTNENLKCDDDISTKSTEGGAYALTVPSGMNLSKYHIVVDVEKDVASDADDGGAKVAVGYTLMAPATKAEVVTPLTTFVSYQMIQTKGLSLDDAVVQTKRDLGIDANTDLSKDYVKSGDRNTHAIARVAAAVLAQTKTDIQALVDDPKVDANVRDGYRKQALKKSIELAGPIIKDAASKLPNSPSIDDVKKGRDDAAKSAKDKVQKEGGNVKKDVQNKADIGKSTQTVRFADVIASESVFRVQAESDDTLWVAKISSTNAGSGIFKTYGSTNGSPWSSISKDGKEVFTAANQWMSVDDANSNFEYSAKSGSDGLITELKDSLTGLREQFSVDSTDLSGQKASKVAQLIGNNDCAYLKDGQACKFGDIEDFQFPNGSKMYKLSTTILADHYSVCVKGSCALIGISDLNALIASTQEGKKDTYIRANGFKIFLKKISDSGGEAKFFNAADDAELGTSTYKILTLGGRQLMEINNPSGVNSTNELITFVEKDGKVFYGSKELKGPTYGDEHIFLNKTALDELLKQLDLPNFTK